MYTLVSLYVFERSSYGLADARTCSLKPFISRTAAVGRKLLNPIWKLAVKHNLTTQTNDWEDITFYDRNGVNTKEFPER